VHDKQVRRRRAVLGLLVGASLILLTAYFGESPNSPLHSVQRGIVAVLSPIQQGASTVLTPVRAAASWVSDTLNAKSELSQYRRLNAHLNWELAQLKGAQLQNQQLSQLVGLDRSDNIAAYSPVAGDVIGQDPSLWYQQIEVDRGTADGVRLNDPVIGEQGLVGKVSTVGGNYSIVTLLTDPSYAVGAEVLAGGSTYAGVLVPQAGNPTSLLLTGLNPQAQIVQGQEVVTSGFIDPGNAAVRSLYPPGIPIGTVSNQNIQDTLANNQQVQVQPFVDLRSLSVVQILTRPVPRGQRAQVPGG
jgi:rod shape-determining protein MreC